MPYIIRNEETGRIADPSMTAHEARSWCERVQHFGKHVAPVGFIDASSQALFRVMRMGRTVWNQGKHRAH